MAALVLAATSVLVAAKPVGAAQVLCGGFGGGPAPSPGGGVAFPDAMHGWLVGVKASLDLCFQSSGAVVATSDGGVTWRSQRIPAGVHGLSGVSFVNDLDGWAVGGNSIIATGNGGATWALQAAPVGVRLANVDFVDSTHGWAVGLTCMNVPSCVGVVLATTNGGLSWASQTVPAGVGALYSVAFSDPFHGWAVGTTDCGQGVFCPGVVVATANGGATWSTQTMPSGILTLQGVTFATSTLGWAVGWGTSCLTAPPCTGVIIATTNGGSTWHTQANPSLEPLSGITFLSSTVAWAVGGSTLLTTPDGGTTWNLHSLPIGVFGRGVIVNSPSAGLVSYSPPPFQIPGPASINKTIDGGTTWQAEQIPRFPSGLFDVAFAAGSAGIATGQMCDAVGAGFLGFATCSASTIGTTGRLTWTAGTTPPSASNSYLDGVAFPTPTTGWAVGNCTYGGTCAPVILMTANGGVTWTSQTVPVGVANLNDVSFAGGSNGWAVGSDCCGAAILATIDAGTTWSVQSLPSGVADLTGVAAVNSTTAWAVGTDINFGSVILGTIDGGTTWTTETIPNASGTQLEDVFFANVSDGWAVGQECSLAACGGVILATANGGSTWSAQTLPPALAGKFPIFYGVDFVNALDGWAVGEDTTGAVILSTTNGGSSWAAQTLPAQLSSPIGVLLAVSFVDSSNGWAVGAVDDTSVILHTTNGGMNWAQQPVDSDVLQSPAISPRPRDAAKQSGALSPPHRVPVVISDRRRSAAR